MKEIYVPINISNLREILPPSEEIIYSTLCKISFSVSDSYWTPKSTTHITEKYEYNSHLLITQKGLAYYYKPLNTAAYKSSVWGPLPTYNTLLNINQFYGSRRFRVSHQDFSRDDLIYYLFEIIPHPDIESTYEFEQRRMRFRPILYKYMLSTTQSWVNYLIENKDRGVKAKPPLWKVDLLTQKFDQSPFKEFIESETSQIDSERKKRKIGREILKDMVAKLNQTGKVAYFKYVVRKGEVKPVLLLRKFNSLKQEMFDPSYIKTLKRTISKQEKYLKKANKY